MKRFAIGAALALCVTLGAAAPARAELLRNAQDRNLCLGVSPSNVSVIWYCNSIGQDWGEGGGRPGGWLTLYDRNSRDPNGSYLNTFGPGYPLSMISGSVYWPMYWRIPSGTGDGCFYYYSLSWSRPDQNIYLVLGVAGARNDQPLRAGTNVILWWLTGEKNQLWCPDGI